MRINRAEFAAALVRQDLTGKELGELTGLSRSTITSVRGGKRVSQATAEKLVRVLGEQIIERREAVI